MMVLVRVVSVSVYEMEGDREGKEEREGVS